MECVQEIIHTKKDVYIETTGTIDFKDSSIGIALANGNLTIKKRKHYFKRRQPIICEF